jgi:hypothetical protein
MTVKHTMSRDKIILAGDIIAQLEDRGANCANIPST